VSSRFYAGLCIIACAQLILGLGSGTFMPLTFFSGVVGGLFSAQLAAVIWIFAIWPPARQGAVLGTIVASILSLGIAMFALIPSNHPTIAPYFYDVMTSGTWPLLGAALAGLWIEDQRASRITTAQLEARLDAQQAVIDAQEKALEDSLKAKGRMAERERLTRDIHDGIGGQLLSLLVGVRDGDMSQAEIERDLQYGLNDLRLIVDSMDHFDSDLKAAFVTFRARATAQLGASDIALNWTETDPFVAANFGPTAILNIYRLMQEVITNAIRHARCDRVDVSVACEQECADLQIEISDNGVGFDSKNISAAGQGLKNMKYRARSIGANLTVSKRPAGGTLVTVIVPTKRAAN
jgi:signal transduction histidine kinase